MSEAPTTGAPRRWGVLIAAGSGIALALSMPGTDIGPLALVALAPLCWLWHDAPPRRAALFGFVAGLAYFGIHLSWTWYFGAVAIVPLVALQAAFWAVAGALVALWAKRGVRSPFVIAAIWVLLEAARTRWPLDGLAWGQVGVALHDQSVGHALASWGGVPLATFVVVVVNAFVADLVRSVRASDRSSRQSAALGLVALIAAVAVATATRFEPHPNGRLRYALIQGNDKNRYLTNTELATDYLTRSHLALAHTLRGRYDLIVFPESALATDPEIDPGLKAEITGLAREHHSWLMANVIDEQTEPGKAFNANRLYSPQGRLLGTYAKRHLVPFGEYVPWRGSLSFISALQQIPHDFTPGTRIGIETVAGHTISSVICFESAFGPLMRESAAAGAEMIVVTTNNRSYRRSANSEQHVALSQMSAAAVGRPFLHASVSGITAVIDADGVIHRETELFHNTVVSGTVVPTTGSTPYVRFGDWVEWGSGILVTAALALGMVRARRIRNTAGQGSEQ
ncbi:MAG: apolipoprotein N-acyltransferase [Acidimicrobiia bacterium]|nr:apolipoprotein N-acyltransferase [Acidimicrobiia bacterium]